LHFDCALPSLHHSFCDISLICTLLVQTYGGHKGPRCGGNPVGGRPVGRAVGIPGGPLHSSGEHDGGVLYPGDEGERTVLCVVRLVFRVIVFSSW